MKRNQERFHKLLSDAVTLFCKEEISYNNSLHVTGMINISVDQDIVYKATIDRNYAYSSDGRSVVYERKLANGGIQVLEGGLRTPIKQRPELRCPQPAAMSPSNCQFQKNTGFSPGNRGLAKRPRNLRRFSSEGSEIMSPRSEVSFSPRNEVPCFRSQNFLPRGAVNPIRSVPHSSNVNQSRSPNVSQIRNVRQPIQILERHPVNSYQQPARRTQIAEANSLQNRLVTEVTVRYDVVEIDSDTEQCESNEVTNSGLSSPSAISLPRNSSDSGYAASTNVETFMPVSDECNDTVSHVDSNISQWLCRAVNYPANSEKEAVVTLSSDEGSDTSVESGDEVIADNTNQDTLTSGSLKMSNSVTGDGSQHYSTDVDAYRSSIVSAKSSFSVHDSFGTNVCNSLDVSDMNRSSSTAMHNSSGVCNSSSIESNAQDPAVSNLRYSHENTAVKSETLDNSVPCDNFDGLRYNDLTENINRVQPVLCENLIENIEPAPSLLTTSDGSYSTTTNINNDNIVKNPSLLTIDETWESTVGNTFDSIFGETSDYTVKDGIADNVGGREETQITLSDLLSGEPTAATSTDTNSTRPCGSGDSELSNQDGNNEYSRSRRKISPFFGAKKFFEDGDKCGDLAEDSDEQLSDPEYLPTDVSNDTDEFRDDEKDLDYDNHKVSGNNKKRRIYKETPKKSHDVDGEFICKYDGCRKVFGLKGNLTRHQRAVHGRRFGDLFSATFECHLSNCRKKFATINALKRHMKARHGCDAGQLEQSIL